MLHVVCAILVSETGEVLAARRSERMPLPLKWEFPGGKIEPGEEPQAALRREIREELSVDILVGEGLEPVDHHYPGFSIRLYPFWCTIASGTILLKEHDSICWMPTHELLTLDWAAADVPVVQALLNRR